MKLLIVNQFFYPDVAATAQLLTDLTEDLRAKGVDITVLTSNSSYLGGKIDLSRNGRYVGAKIIRVNSSSFGRRFTLGRAIDYATFYALIMLKSLLLPRFDKVIFLTTPPLISLLGLILKAVKRTKYICLVEDLYPDLAIALGFMKANSPFARLSGFLSNIAYRKSEQLIAISENMRQKLIGKGVAAGKISVIDNWADKENIYPVKKEDNWFLQKHNLGDSFIVQYSGNMGLGHEFSTILEGMKYLRSYADIKFMFIGDGKLKPEILAFKEKETLDNLIVLPYQERPDLSFSISAANVSLITLKNNLEGCMLPSKLYGIMAAASPVIFVGSSRSDIARIISQAECGFQVGEGNVTRFSDLLLQLYRNRPYASKLGQNGYRFFLKHFERKNATRRYYEILTSNDQKPKIDED